MKEAVLKFYSFESSPWNAAKSILIAHICAHVTNPELAFEVWFESCLTKEAYEALQTGLKDLV